MFLSEDFISLCKINNYKWSKCDLDDFTIYGKEVAEHYLNDLSFESVLSIFDSIENNDCGYLTINMCDVEKYHKSYDVMYYFFEEIKKYYFKLFIEKFEDDINTNNPNVIIDKYVEIFKPVFSNKKYLKIISTGESFFRARLGFDYKKDSDEQGGEKYYPFTGDKMTNPPSSLAKEGRFNRDGYSYYYLSYSEDGAISEVRPRVGELCTVAEFEVKEDLHLFEFGDLLDLLNYFSKPVIDENKVHYKYTQFFSDVIFKCGFDGIHYYGVQTKFLCFVCFYPNKIAYKEGTANVCQIEIAKYIHYKK